MIVSVLSVIGNLIYWATQTVLGVIVVLCALVVIAKFIEAVFDKTKKVYDDPLHLQMMTGYGICGVFALLLLQWIELS